MTSIARRLTALEAITPAEWSEREASFYRWLSVPSLATVARQTAEAKAHRRWLHERGRVAGERQGGHWYVTSGHGWYQDTTEAERRDLTRAELDSVTWDALEVWGEEADAAGWPSLHGTPDGYAAFCDRLARDRQMMAVHRGRADTLAAAWRRDHPAWHPDMTEAESDAWELALMLTEGGHHDDH